MTDQPSMADLKHARIVAAVRSIAVLLMDLEAGKDDRALRIINMKADLTDEERAELLAIVLSTFPADQAEQLVKLCFGEVGIPISGLGGSRLEEARYWARQANASELRGYCQATFEAMSEPAQRAVFEWMKKRLTPSEPPGGVA